MLYPLTITIDQTDDGRYRAFYTEAATTRSIEGDNLAILMDHLKDALGVVLNRDSGEDEDEELADARAAMEDVRLNGGVPWEQVEAEMGF